MGPSSTRPAAVADNTMLINVGNSTHPVHQQAVACHRAECDFIENCGAPETKKAALDALFAHKVVRERRARRRLSGSAASAGVSYHLAALAGDAAGEDPSGPPTSSAQRLDRLGSSALSLGGWSARRRRR